MSIRNSAMKELDLLTAIVERMLDLRAIINEGKPSYAQLEENNYALQRELSDERRHSFEHIWRAIRACKGRRLDFTDAEPFDHYTKSFLKLETPTGIHLFAINHGDNGADFDFTGIEQSAIEAMVDHQSGVGREIQRIYGEWLYKSFENGPIFTQNTTIADIVPDHGEFSTQGWGNGGEFFYFDGQPREFFEQNWAGTGRQAEILKHYDLWTEWRKLHAYDFDPSRPGANVHGIGPDAPAKEPEYRARVEQEDKEIRERMAKRRQEAIESMIEDTNRKINLLPIPADPNAPIVE